MGSLVHVVEDDAKVRSSLTDLFESAGLAVKSYSSAESFLASCAGTVPGCLVLDVCLPGMSGLELQDELICRQDPIPVILLTGHADVPMAVEAMSKGALGFFEKPFRTRELIELAKRAIRFHQKRLEEDRFMQEIVVRFERLSPREKQVVDLVTHGSPTKQIARQLGIGERTVETHRARIMRKLEVNSLAQLVEWAIAYRSAKGRAKASGELGDVRVVTDNIPYGR